MLAQIRNKEGTFGNPLPIKKENFVVGVNPIQMATTLQLKALQEQVQDMTNQLEVIDQNVKAVLQGQQNDRIGLYYSGMSLYLESKVVSNAELKNALVGQALKSLSEAIHQLVLTMKTDINYVKNKEYNKVRKGQIKLLDEKIQNINQSFLFIHQANMMRAGIYCDCGEIVTMTNVLKNYSYFIENDVVKNAETLSLCDYKDNGTERGIWKSRANLKLDMNKISKYLIQEEKTIYFGITGDEQ